MFAFILGCVVGWMIARFGSALKNLFKSTEQKIEKAINDASK